MTVDNPSLDFRVIRSLVNTASGVQQAFARVFSTHVSPASPDARVGLQALARERQGQAVGLPPIERMRAFERVSRIRELAIPGEPRWTDRVQQQQKGIER